MPDTSALLQDRKGKNLSEIIADILGERIIRGRLEPGERLLEVQLADELQVSRGPVREAFRLLEKRRLIRVVPRRGAVVTDMDVVDIDNLYEVVTPLYVLLARKTAENWTPENLSPVYVVVGQMINAAEQGDEQGYYEHNFRFAHACAPIAANPLLDTLLNELEPGLRRVLYLSRHRRRTAMAAHLAVMRRMMRSVADRHVAAAHSAIVELAAMERDLAVATLEERCDR